VVTKAAAKVATSIPPQLPPKMTKDKKEESSLSNTWTMVNNGALNARALAIFIGFTPQKPPFGTVQDRNIKVKYRDFLRVESMRPPGEYVVAVSQQPNYDTGAFTGYSSFSRSPHSVYSHTFHSISFQVPHSFCTNI
jgi:hypothetical protein